MRPRAWRTIKFATPFYHIHVNPVVGAKQLLRELGYRKETERSLEFYEDTVPESDIQKVKEITAELLVAKLETEGFEQRGMKPWDLVQPDTREVLPPTEDMFGEESLRSHGSGVQMASVSTVTQGSHTFDTLTSAQHSGTAHTHKVSVCVDTCSNTCLHMLQHTYVLLWSSMALCFLILVFVGKDICYARMLVIVSFVQ